MSSGKMMNHAFKHVKSQIKKKNVKIKEKNVELLKKDKPTIPLESLRLSGIARRMYRANIKEAMREVSSKRNKGKGELTANNQKRLQRANGVNRKKLKKFS